MTSTDREGASSLARSGPGPRVAAIAPPIIAPEHPILSAIRSPSLNAWRLLASAIGPTIAGYSSRIDVYTAKAFLNRWGMVTKEAHDLGTVYITFVGDRIVSFRFTNAWPRARFRPGRHFMDARFKLPTVDDSEERRVKIFRTVRASDALQHAIPFWHRYFGSISAELESILEGTFTVTKNGLPLQPIFQRNHPSWENDEYAQEVLLQVLAEWFNAGSLEYVERFHRLPHCILAFGSVSKVNAPVPAAFTDGRPINIYAESWRVKYAAGGNMSYAEHVRIDLGP